MKNSFFGLYIRTLVATLILLGSVAYVGFLTVGKTEDAKEIKAAVEQRYEFMPSAEDGISFLFIIKNTHTQNGIYLLASCKPQSAETVISPLPWQLFGESGTKHRNLDSFLEKGTAKDVLNAVNSIFGTEVKKYICVEDSVVADACDMLGGIVYDIPSDISYENENTYVSIRSGKQQISGDMLIGLLENPENFDKSTNGVNLFGNVFYRFLEQQFPERAKECAKTVFEMLIDGAQTNLTAEDFIMREDALNYMLENDKKSTVLTEPSGTFDLTRDNFTPSADFLSAVKEKFTS